VPLVGQLLVNLFVGLAAFFAKWVTRKVAAVAAGIAVMATITAALFGVISGLIAGIVVSMPAHAAIQTGIWILIPDNAALCLSAMFATDVAVGVYRLNVLNVQFAVYAP
jgi:hypothetical protein